MSADKGSRMLSLLALACAVLNSVASFVVFSFLDLLDAVLCVVYKVADFAVEAEWRPCYCSSAEDMITSDGSYLAAPERIGRRPKVVRLCSTKLQLEDVSETLYYRPSRIAEFGRKVAVAAAANTSMSARSPVATAFAVNPGIVEMIKGKIGRKRPQPIARWSDCDCKTCDSWSRTSSTNGSLVSDQLYVHVEEPRDGRRSKSDVIFIHGFISSSTFWTETVFREFSEEARSGRRLFAVDLLGFGRSPKPADSLYTLREHVDMIEKSVLERYNVRSFHVVAHSLGSIIALALAVKHPDAVKSLTLLSPPYFPVPKGEEATQYMMRRVAPRKVWPAIAFGASMACWYEHVSRTICLVICKHHRLWDFLFRIVTGNRLRTFLIDGFMCHTHHAAWHTLHNVLCGSAYKMENYLDAVRDRVSCGVAVFHGRDDELLPAECSHAVGAKIPRATVKVFDRKDHVTIVVGQQKAFASDLEAVWRRNERDA